ncbi:unnamed protein product [Brachionus calyciflorus]|uniref:Uncharacterized protein n=1 Tax=Brachionus calyciflorus TaxID=104777 RepID=A0A813RIL5_9BILA|nr:unnamed protein product [Brachionus calyciflorus]
MNSSSVTNKSLDIESYLFEKNEIKILYNSIKNSNKKLFEINEGNFGLSNNIWSIAILVKSKTDPDQFSEERFTGHGRSKEIAKINAIKDFLSNSSINKQTPYNLKKTDQKKNSTHNSEDLSLNSIEPVNISNIPNVSEKKFRFKKQQLDKGSNGQKRCVQNGSSVQSNDTTLQYGHNISDSASQPTIRNDKNGSKFRSIPTCQKQFRFQKINLSDLKNEHLDKGSNGQKRCVQNGSSVQSNDTTLQYGHNISDSASQPTIRNDKNDFNVESIETRPENEHNGSVSALIPWIRNDRNDLNVESIETTPQNEHNGSVSASISSIRNDRNDLNVESIETTLQNEHNSSESASNPTRNDQIFNNLALNPTTSGNILTSKSSIQITKINSNHQAPKDCTRNLNEHDHNCTVGHSNGYCLRIREKFGPVVENRTRPKKRKVEPENIDNLNYTVDEYSGFKIENKKLKINVHWKQHPELTIVFLHLKLQLQRCWTRKVKMKKEIL